MSLTHPSQKTKELLVGSLLGAAVQDHVTQLLLQRQGNTDENRYYIHTHTHHPNPSEINTNLTPNNGTQMS